MKSWISWMLIGLALLVSNAATADYTAQLLRDLCESKEAPAKLSCVSFIYGYRMGHADGMVSTLMRTKTVGRDWKMPDDEAMRRYSYACVPSSVTNVQLAEVFTKHMRDHPEELHEDAGRMLGTILQRYFPCVK